MLDSAKADLVESAARGDLSNHRSDITVFTVAVVQTCGCEPMEPVTQGDEVSFSIPSEGTTWPLPALPSRYVFTSL
jgi:hypothetical protein